VIISGLARKFKGFIHSLEHGLRGFFVIVRYEKTMNFSWGT
jgi:hypothetical protein